MIIIYIYKFKQPNKYVLKYSVMVTLSIIFILISVPLFSTTIDATIHNRITLITFIVAATISIYSIDICDSTNYYIFNNSFVINNFVLYIEAILFISSAAILTGWSNSGWNKPSISEYSLLVLFTTIGASILISSNDLISVVLSLEIQSFSLYVLATIYRNSETATAAGLKYFLLGGFSSAIIILGTALIYIDCGTTNIEDIFILNSNQTITSTFILGITLIGLGIMFKIAAAPLHNWAPDVYDGTPTIITSWLIVIPKISLFVLLYNLTSGIDVIWSIFIIISAVLSLIIGTVLGLVQTKLKRLLTYSTISHVGFILLALSINTFEGNTAFIFYITQYTFSNITLFLLVLAIGYSTKSSKDLSDIIELNGLNKYNPIIALCLSLTLLSIAGIPPMIGFFAKMNVLYATISTGSYYVSVIAIVTSVISTYYYLHIITAIYFSNPNSYTSISNKITVRISTITNVHYAIISLGMLPIIGFLAYPNFLLDISSLMAMIIYTI